LPFLDELAMGILPASTPELASAFGLSGATAAAIALLAPIVLCALVEPRLVLVADRAPDRRRWVRLGAAALIVGALVIAAAPAAWVAALALALYVPIWSTGLATAQNVLVEAAPAEVERAMTRWTLAAATGDLAAPGLLALAALVDRGWRASFVVVALIAAASAWALRPLPARAPATPAPDEAADEAPLDRTTLLAALRRPRLVAWLAGAWLCTLLDEIFVAFAVLGLEARYHASPAGRALVLTAFLGAGALALVVLERIVARHDGRRLLAWISAAGVVAYVAWWLAPSLAWSAALAALVGATTAGQHPLAKAQAFRAAPGTPALVNALDAALGIVDLVCPFVLALVAARWGARAVLLLLVVQPAALLVLALLVAPARATKSSVAGPQR
jgi:MFS family permease